VLRSCLHIGYINSKIIKDYKIKNSKNVNVDSGIIEDSAISEFVSLIPPLTEKQLTKVFYEFFMSLAKKGLTSIQTNDYN
jgi:predicted amidohydrolase YtcJ